jgi:hypothetical protein
LPPPQINAELAKISVRSARWLLAVERTLWRKLHDGRMLLLKSTQSNTPKLIRISILLQEPLMSRLAVLLRSKSSSNGVALSKKIIEGNCAEELQFFKNIMLPRLAEAGFSSVSEFFRHLELRLKAEPHTSPHFVNRFVDYVVSDLGPLSVADSAWIDQFKLVWLQCASVR